MTLDNWITWAFRPHRGRGRHQFHSWALARQAARDLQAPVEHEDFIAAMLRAGYQIVERRGRAVFFNVQDTIEKRAYIRSRYLAADDRVRHPLEKQP